ncbi:MAG: aldehyde ferredoxin oxidoreductase family protein [Chloroflexi bacterium]|nr:aldehyde ferredoxin oxidoreductase family protein [Chloroflexota bacterium]
MTNSAGYVGTILRVDLSSGAITTEQPGDDFYRAYFGGSGFVAYFLLKEAPPGADPLGPENRLVFASGPITGLAVGGCGRHSVGAKSPLTGGFGDSQSGGYWGSELKFAGFDAIVVHGRAAGPVYLLVQDGKAELRDAGHLWGKATAETQKLLRDEHGDPGLRVAQIGPAGERLVRYACIINDLHDAAGRTGLGAVMGSKNLKAIAVRGRNRLAVAEPKTVSDLGRWLRDNVMSLAKPMYDQGTSRLVTGLNKSGGLPTRNFQTSYFEGAAKISGEAMRNSILVGRHSCYACPVRCKRVVEVKGPTYHVSPDYGGPEYETIAALGSDCGVDDLAAIAKGSELCNAYGMDTISAGATIAFAMECFENGLLTDGDTGGTQLRFGNAAGMVEMVEKIAQRKGLGNLLAEGSARAARKIGQGAERFAMHVKGQEAPMHEPRLKQGLGLGYALSPTGADHCHNLHDIYYTSKGPGLENFKALGITQPLPASDLSPAKVRMLLYNSQWMWTLNSLAYCLFVPLNYGQVTELLRGATGWNASLWEMMKVGDRVRTMARWFNVREGLADSDDVLPDRFFTPPASGPLASTSIDKAKLDAARATYYAMTGWDDKGKPRPEKLAELALDWLA